DSLFLVGKSPARQLPDFFLREMKLPIHPFESPNFLPTAKNKQVCLTRSLVYNLFRLPKYLHSMHFIQQVIRESEVDVVVNFYELLTGLTYLVYRPKAVLVCVAHQYLFLHPDFEFPRANRLSLFSLRLFTRLTAIGATKRLALSFRKMREVPRLGIVVVPPLLRRALFNIQPSTSKRSIDPALFRHWVQQAKWLILREFREDLLSPDSIGFVHLLKGKLI
ncbi:MAG: hypothetical protein PUF30_08510, partial [bacterium]|nr:hypothetical protein [bacterium]